MRVSKKSQDEILEDVYQVALKRGLHSLTLRSIAKEIDTSARMLVYHFGSFEELMLRLNKKYSLSQKESALKKKAAADRVGDIMKHQFNILREPKNHNLFFLFSELLAQAVREPKKNKAFVQSTFEEWLDLIHEVFQEQGFDRRQSDALGTLIIAIQRGLMVDLMCHRGSVADRNRVEDSINLFKNLLNDDLKLLREKSLEDGL